jgi:hypothetical protein
MDRLTTGRQTGRYTDTQTDGQIVTRTDAKTTRNFLKLSVKQTKSEGSQPFNRLAYSTK